MDKGKKKEVQTDGRSSPPSKKRKRRKRYTLYYIILLLLISSISVYLSLTKFFLIEKIDVAGNNKYLPEEIISAAGITIGTNLFRVDSQSVKENLIKQFVYIEDVKVKRRFPPSIVLEITQAEPFALLKATDGYLLISEQGRVLEHTDKFVNTQMPVVMGVDEKTDESSQQSTSSSTSSNQDGSQKMEASPISTDIKSFGTNSSLSSTTQGVKEGEYLSKNNNETLAMLSSLIEAFERTGFTDVTHIDVSDRLNMKIVYQDRLLIELGSEGDLEYKLNFVKKIKEYNEETNFEGIVDATIPKELRVREMDIDSYLSQEKAVSSPSQPTTPETSQESAQQSSEQSKSDGESSQENSVSSSASAAESAITNAQSQ